MTADTTTGPIYDDSEWPLFVTRMPPRRLSAEAFAAHLEILREPYRRGKPFVVMIVMGEHPPLPAAQRQAAAEAMRIDGEMFPGLLRAKAIVALSPLEHGVVTAVSWIARPDYPFVAFDNVPTAKAWLLAHLPTDAGSARPSESKRRR